MNNLSLSMVDLVYYNSVLRDTLQYTLNHPTYDVKTFEHRRQILKNGLKEGTMLRSFINQNGEAGKKLEEKINALYALVYADDSTICRVANNELRVDKGQNIAIFEAVIPLYEEISNVIGVYINMARKQNLLEDDFLKLLVNAERMYRSVAYLGLFYELHRLFIEFNKALNETKGKPTPQSNFIQGELAKVYRLTSFAYNHQRATDAATWKVGDTLLILIQHMTGRRDLPAGRKFQDIFSEAKAIVDERVNQIQPEYTALMKTAIEELNTKLKENNNQLEIKFPKPEEQKKN